MKYYTRLMLIQYTGTAVLLIIGIILVCISKIPTVVTAGVCILHISGMWYMNGHYRRDEEWKKYVETK